MIKRTKGNPPSAMSPLFCKYESMELSICFLFPCFSFLFVCFLAFQMTSLMRLGYNVIMSLKNVLSLKLEQNCYIYQLLRRPKLENFFIYILHQLRLNQHFKCKNSVLFTKHFSTKQELITRTILCVHHFAINKKLYN